MLHAWRQMERLITNFLKNILTSTCHCWAANPALSVTYPKIFYCAKKAASIQWHYSHPGCQLIAARCTLSEACLVFSEYTSTVSSHVVAIHKAGALWRQITNCAQRSQKGEPIKCFCCPGSSPKENLYIDTEITKAWRFKGNLLTVTPKIMGSNPEIPTLTGPWKQVSQVYHSFQPIGWLWFLLILSLVQNQR